MCSYGPARVPARAGEAIVLAGLVPATQDGPAGYPLNWQGIFSKLVAFRMAVVQPLLHP